MLAAERVGRDVWRAGAWCYNERGKETPPMIPLRDENPTRITPYVTWALLAVNIVVYLLQATGGTRETQLGIVGALAGWTMVPAELTQGVDLRINGPTLQPTWLTIFTSMFMHGGFMHIAGNMVYLIVFGNNIEDALGHGKFLAFYLVCGVLAAASHVLIGPLSPIPTLGASGAIAGVLGAYLVLFPHARVHTLVFLGILITTVRLPALILLGFWIVSQFFSQVTGALAGGERGGGVAYMAHIGGFIAGMVLIKLMGAHPTRRTPDSYYRPRYVGEDGRFRF
jgi:membrane associated rhomboid family serine protease